MNHLLGANILSSVKEFIAYRLLKDGAAYSTKTVPLYNYSDLVYTGKYVYGSPYAGWVYNSGVPGVTVASGIMQNSGFIPKGSGLYIDYVNGRVISNSAITGTLTANVSVPDVNTYVTTYSDYKLIAETNYLTPPNYQNATGYLKPYSQVLSALFFRLSQTTNDPLAFGGTDWTVYNIKVTAAMMNNAHLTLVADILRDTKNRIFPLLSGTPFNEYRDLKSGWNYTDYLTNPGNYGIITSANLGYIENDIFAAKNPHLEVGLGTLEIKIARAPLSEYP